MIRTLIVDDEPLALESLRVRLNHQTGFEIVGEATDGPSTVEAIQSLRPDIVFLDVQLPGFDGLEALRRVASDYLPLVIFVTAYDQFAIKAFEANAVDYLLKPYSQKRFDQAVARIRLALAKEVALAQNHEKVVRLLDPGSLGPSDVDQLKRRSYVNRLAVKDRSRFLILKTELVDWMRSAANYVELHSNGRNFLLRTTMNDLEELLDPSSFARIHRAVIVNVDRVSEVVPSEHGDFVVRMQDGTQLRLSRTFRERLLPRIGPAHKAEFPHGTH